MGIGLFYVCLKQIKFHEVSAGRQIFSSETSQSRPQDIILIDGIPDIYLEFLVFTY